MNYITNFYKLILLILCLLLLYITIKNFNLELFQEQTDELAEQETQKTEETNTIKPNNVSFTINKVNNNLELNWDKDERYIISKYIIIIYVDNQGPYLKIINAGINDKYFSYIYENIINNAIYKIAIVAVTDKGEMSEMNIKEFKSTFEGNVDRYSHRFNSKIMCDPYGQHKILDKCQNDKFDIIATDKLSDEETYYFDNEEHNALMESLNKKTKFDFKI